MRLNGAGEEMGPSGRKKCVPTVNHMDDEVKQYSMSGFHRGFKDTQGTRFLSAVSEHERHE